MREKYIVLSDTRGHRTRGDQSFTPSDIEVGIEDLLVEQTFERSRDDSLIALAPAMPVALVAPNVSPPAEPPTEGVAWGICAVGADRSRFSGAGVTVAVLDTGINGNHPAFANVLMNPMNFTKEPAGDFNGHGTHCAGVIFGRAVHGTRIGVAPGVRSALIGKVLTKDGSGSSEHVAQAILWAVNNGALVVLMSLGIDFPGYVESLVARGDLPLKAATSRALDGFRKNLLLFERVYALVRTLAPKCVLIAAAGNESQRRQNASYRISVAAPAVFEGIVSVGAVARAEGGLEVASFSNTGPSVVAPGVNILSADARTDGLISMEGTSMAAPHAAGVAALWAQMLRDNDRLNDGQLAALLRAHARVDSLKPGYFPGDVGAGIVMAP